MAAARRMRRLCTDLEAARPLPGVAAVDVENKSVTVAGMGMALFSEDSYPRGGVLLPPLEAALVPLPTLDVSGWLQLPEVAACRMQVLDGVKIRAVVSAGDAGREAAASSITAAFVAMRLAEPYKEKEVRADLELEGTRLALRRLVLFDGINEVDKARQEATPDRQAQAIGLARPGRAQEKAGLDLALIELVLRSAIERQHGDSDAVVRVAELRTLLTEVTHTPTLFCMSCGAALQGACPSLMTICGKPLCIFSLRRRQARDKWRVTNDLMYSIVRNALLDDGPGGRHFLTPEPTLVDEAGAQLPLTVDVLAQELRPLASLKAAEASPSASVRALATWAVVGYRSRITPLDFPHCQVYALTVPGAGFSNEDGAETMTLFHGTTASRLHAILFGGLRAATRENGLMRHGRVYGTGVYAAPDVRTALRYGSYVLACEVCKRGARKAGRAGSFYVIEDERNIAVRVLAVNPFHRVACDAFADLAPRVIREGAG